MVKNGEELIDQVTPHNAVGGTGGRGTEGAESHERAWVVKERLSLGLDQVSRSVQRYST